MTGQKLGQFYVADLSNGNYTVNDPVFMRDLRNSSEVDANETTATLLNAGIELEKTEN